MAFRSRLGLYGGPRGVTSRSYSFLLKLFPWWEPQGFPIDATRVRGHNQNRPDDY